MDWLECNKKKIVKEVSIDSDLISSLIKSSKNKAESQSKLKLDDITAGSKFSLAYDSLREILEALALKNRFKIYNHECYTSFLKEILKQECLGEEFDELRKIRNSINYYGKDVSVNEAKEIIERMEKLRIVVLKLLD